MPANQRGVLQDVRDGSIKPILGRKNLLYKVGYIGVKRKSKL